MIENNSMLGLPLIRGGLVFRPEFFYKGHEAFRIGSIVTVFVTEIQKVSQPFLIEVLGGDGDFCL